MSDPAIPQMSPDTPIFNAMVRGAPAGGTPIFDALAAELAATAAKTKMRKRKRKLASAATAS